MNALYMRHFMNPKNVGSFVDADCSEEYAFKEDNLTVRFFAKLKNGVITVRYKVQGCSVAIVMCSILSEKAQGSSARQLAVLEFDSVFDDIRGGLEPGQEICAKKVFDSFIDFIKKC